MTRHVWCSDIHLDHIDTDERLIAFATELVKDDPVGVFITGDISNARRLIYHLSAVERVVQRPVRFVLGNHDYYDSDIVTVRKQMHELSNVSSFLRYMPTTPYIILSSTTALIGHDGWYDGLNGDAKNSRFMLADWVYIKDFVKFSGGNVHMNITGGVKDQYGLIEEFQKLAKESVMHVRSSIKAAAKTFKEIIVLTHIPPFEESHMHQGEKGDRYAQPWFTSKLMGDMLLDASRSYPNVNFRVLAGHTHGSFDGQITPNLRVSVAGASYGSPCAYETINVK